MSNSTGRLIRLLAIGGEQTEDTCIDWLLGVPYVDLVWLSGQTAEFRRLRTHIFHITHASLFSAKVANVRFCGTLIHHRNWRREWIVQSGGLTLRGLCAEDGWLWVGVVAHQVRCRYLKLKSGHASATNVKRILTSAKPKIYWPFGAFSWLKSIASLNRSWSREELNSSSVKLLSGVSLLAVLSWENTSRLWRACGMLFVFWMLEFCTLFNF